MVSVGRIYYMSKLDLSNGTFLKCVMDAIDGYNEQFGVNPSIIRMRKPFYDGMQAEFEMTTGRASGLLTVQGVVIEKVSNIYKYDLEVL